MSKFYSGVRFFEPVASKFGLHVDQFNFVICMFVACLMGRQFQSKYNIKHIGADQRHMFAFLGGFTLALFCFGPQIMHLFILSSVCYGILTYLPYRYSRYIILSLTMAYLAIAHLARQHWDYGGYTLDITGPLMVLVQRLSMLAFNLYDGDQIKNKRKLDYPDCVKHAILDHPTPLQFFSYSINFQTVLIGPFLFYSDYLKFIEGREIEYAETTTEKEYFIKHRSALLDAEDTMKKYIFMMIVFGSFHLFVFPFLQPSFYLTDEFGQFTFVQKVFYLILVSPMLRQQYYFAWSLTSLCCLCSGLGFSGFSKTTGKAEYTLVESFDLKNIELGPNLKAIIDGWNKSANVWLRECVYNRAPKRIATPCVFICSAIWHGFYPGYYIFFITAGFYLEISRMCRRYVRPYFLYNFGDGNSSKVYDILTTSVTTFCLNYMAVPFVLLEFNKAIKFYSQFYFCGHIAIPILICLFQFIPRPKRRQDRPINE